MEACPIHIEQISPIIDMRRFMTMTEGQVPNELQNTLENLETHGNPWGLITQQEQTGPRLKCTNTG